MNTPGAVLVLVAVVLRDRLGLRDSEPVEEPVREGTGVGVVLAVVAGWEYLSPPCAV